MVYIRHCPRPVAVIDDSYIDILAAVPNVYTNVEHGSVHQASITEHKASITAKQSVGFSPMGAKP